jgi:hypothetical protein
MNLFPPARFRLYFAALTLLHASAAGLWAAAPGRTALDDVVALPEFQVISERPLPAREDWRYVKLGNFEVLSSTSERTTREFVKDLREFQLVLAAISRQMLIQAELPVMVVLCGHDGQFERFAAKPAVRSGRGRGTSLVRDNETAAIIIDYNRRWSGDEIAIMPPQDSLGRGERRGDDVTWVARREVYTTQEFVRQYIHLALSQFNPRLPAWAAEGIANIYSDIEYTNKWIEVGLPKSFRNEYVVESSFANLSSSFTGMDGGGYGSSSFYNSSTSENGLINSAGPSTYVQPLYIMPFAEMLAITYDSPLLAGGSIDGYGRQHDTWRRQATAFTHMCLYGRNGRFQKGYLKFTTLTANQPPTEALFRECFGLSYKDMAMELRSYTEFTDYKSTVYKPGKGENILRPAPPIQTRPATDGEIGRIKGETFRLAGQDDAARNEFIIAYLRGDRDPQLLGSLGLMARRRGDPARAKTYLEAVAATAAPIPRPRAYLEVARLRLAQHQSANAGRPLDVNQLADVLTPLFVAQKLPQQLAEVYLEIARAWESASVIPDRGNLAALEYGISIFPQNGTLIVATARLLIHHGYKADAAPLIQRALDATRDPQLKVELEQLRQQVDVAPPA